MTPLQHLRYRAHGLEIDIERYCAEAVSRAIDVRCCMEKVEVLRVQHEFTIDAILVLEGAIINPESIVGTPSQVILASIPHHLARPTEPEAEGNVEQTRPCDSAWQSVPSERPEGVFAASEASRLRDGGRG